METACLAIEVVEKVHRVLDGVFKGFEGFRRHKGSGPVHLLEYARSLYPTTGACVQE